MFLKFAIFIAMHDNRNRPSSVQSSFINKSLSTNINDESDDSIGKKGGSRFMKKAVTEGKLNSH